MIDVHGPNVSKVSCDRCRNEHIIHPSVPFSDIIDTLRERGWVCDEVTAQEVCPRCMVKVIEPTNINLQAANLLGILGVSTCETMTNEELGRRAVACKHWRWMPGMVTTTGRRIVHVDEDDGTAYFRETFIGTCPIDNDAAPDLSDPATIGCLLQLVREAWGDDIVVLGGLRHVEIYQRTEAIAAWLEGDLYCPVWSSNMRVSEAEALVAALEAAP